MAEIHAEIIGWQHLRCRPTFAFYTKVLGMRMDDIFPADDPALRCFRVMVMRLRLDADHVESSPCCAF